MLYRLLLVDGNGETRAVPLTVTALREFPGPQSLSVHFRPVRNDLLFDSAKEAGRLAYRIVIGWLGTGTEAGAVEQKLTASIRNSWASLPNALIRGGYSLEFPNMSSCHDDPHGYSIILRNGLDVLEPKLCEDRTQPGASCKKALRTFKVPI